MSYAHPPFTLTPPARAPIPPAEEATPWVLLAPEFSANGVDDWEALATQDVAPDPTPETPLVATVQIDDAPAPVGYFRFSWQTELGSNSVPQIVFSPEAGDEERLVSLAAVKDYMFIEQTDASNDERLNRSIAGVRAVVEDIAGPIIPTRFYEWHAGGGRLLSLHHPPSRGLGTTPLLTVESCVEYSGAVGTMLEVVEDPSLQTSASVTTDERGIVTRGGARFAGSVYVVYLAGQQEIPANVHEAALELVRVNTKTTQAVGTGEMTVADAQDSTGPSLGYFVPRRVRELLAPNDDPRPLVA